jgi:hypothetical protein
MKELFEPIARIVLLTLLFGILAFPVLGTLQWILPEKNTPFYTYIETLSHLWLYVYDRGDWAAVIVISLVFLYFSNSYAQTAQDVRLKRVMMEYERWGR